MVIWSDVVGLLILLVCYYGFVSVGRTEKLGDSAGEFGRCCFWRMSWQSAKLNSPIAVVIGVDVLSILPLGCWKVLYLLQIKDMMYRTVSVFERTFLLRSGIHLQRECWISCHCVVAIYREFFGSTTLIVDTDSIGTLRYPMQQQLYYILRIIHYVITGLKRGMRVVLVTPYMRLGRSNQV